MSQKIEIICEKDLNTYQVILTGKNSNFSEYVNKKTAFKDLEDFTKRTGISDPLGLFTNRILQEIKGTERYFLFPGRRFFIRRHNKFNCI